MSEDPDERPAACPHCSARFRVRRDQVGRPLGCPHCGRAIGPAPLFGSGSGSGEVPAGVLAIPDPHGHVETTCPDCGAALRVRSRYLGRHVRCGGCGGKFRVEPARAVSIAPPTAAGLALALAPTPDPDDPWQGRAEVMRLLDELAELKARNTALAAEVERLGRERDAALRELKRLSAGPGRLAIPFDRDDAAPFPYLKDAAGVPRG